MLTGQQNVVFGRRKSSRPCADRRGTAFVRLSFVAEIPLCGAAVLVRVIGGCEKLKKSITRTATLSTRTRTMDNAPPLKLPEATHWRVAPGWVGLSKIKCGHLAADRPAADACLPARGRGPGDKSAQSRLSAGNDDSGIVRLLGLLLLAHFLDLRDNIL